MDSPSSPVVSSPPPLSHQRFCALFAEVAPELLRYVMTIIPNVADAQDLVQETAIALWNSIDRYDPSKPFKPWARQIALNQARQFLRVESRRRRFVEEEVLNLIEARRIALAPKLDARRNHLSDCLSRLPTEQRTLIRGYYFEEETIESLAARLNRGVEAIYKALQRTRQALSLCLDRKLQMEP
ncbi:MAG: hypothetical protein RLZZ399_553 [Verrucomicrobiota bacterium]